MKTVVLVGLGAIGGVYGQMLQQNPNIQFKVAVDEERKKRYLANPFKINGEAVIFDYVTPEEINFTADLIIFVTKFGQLKDALSLVDQAVGKDTFFLSLLNGISSEAVIGEHFGKENVLFAMCNGLDATRIDRDLSYTTSGKISFGEPSNKTMSAGVKMVAEIFETSGIAWEVPQDMQQTLWYKFMVNVGVNQVTAITRSPYGVVQKSQAAQKIVKAAMLEVVQLAEKENIALTEEMIDDWFKKVLAPLNPAGKTSMLQDVEQGRPTEVALFAEEVLQLGIKHNIPTPINEVFYQLIRTIEDNNQLGF